MVAKWYLLPFVVLTVFAYHCWYVRLIDRGYGLLYNAMRHHDQFVAAQIAFALVGAGGVVLFEVFRMRLPRWMRFAYMAMIASMIAFFVVDRIVVIFGPTPYWLHP